MLAGLVMLSLAALAEAQYWTAAPAPVVESAAAYQSAEIVAAPGAKLIVSGQLRRLNADGTVDAAFSAPSDADYHALLVFPDNRVLVCRSASSGPDDPVSEQCILRLVGDGSIDATFAPVLTDGIIDAAHLLSGDRVLLSGRIRSVNGRESARLCVLNADGSISTTFTSPFDGVGLTTFVAPLPNGKIAVGGDFQAIGSTSMAYLGRLNADGSVDSTFASGAPLIWEPSGLFAAGEKLIVPAGSTVFRLNGDGSRDADYTAYLHAFPSEFGPLQSDGKLLYLIEPSAGATRELRRLNADGSRDESFLVTTLKHAGFAATRPVIGTDGLLYVASALTEQRQVAGIRISRIRSDGTIDEPYRPHLTAPTDITKFARGADGTLFVAGDFDHVKGQPVAWGLARLRADGSADSSFAPVLSPYEYPERVWVQPNGMPIVALFQPGFPGDWFLGLVRLSADGSRDASFQKVERYPAQLAFDGSGRIYAAEATASGFNIVRYSADGVLDSTFTAVPATSSIFAVWPDGSVAVTAERDAGETGAGTLKRYRADGTAHATFSVSGAVPDRLFALAPLPDGRLLAIGSSTRSAGATLAYYRYATSGAVDFQYFGKVLGAAPLALGSSQALEIAGVVYDLLHAAAAPADFHQRISVRTGSATLELDVGVDGRLLTNLDGFTCYAKTSPSPPTYDSAPVPTITGAGTGVLNLGGEMMLYVDSSGALPQTIQWFKDGVAISGATGFNLSVPAAPSGAGSYTVTANNANGSATSTPVVVTYNTAPAAPTVTVVDYDEPVPTRVPSAQPPAELILTTELRSFIATATGNPVPTIHWEHNGRVVPAPVIYYFLPPIEDYDLGPTSRKRDIHIKAEPAGTGLYTIVAANDPGTVTSLPMLVGLAANDRIVGDASELGPNTLHPSGRTIDQLLLRGPAAAFTADKGQVARLSFIDLDGDIVQVEFSGAGMVSLSLVVSDPRGRQPPLNYTQPGVSYMHGHAAIVITGVDETSHLSVFSVGRANAYNQSLFRDGVTYDGVADLAFVAILSRNGAFGSLRCANVNFFDTQGFTGIYAPGVRFTGPVYLGNIEGFGAAPVLVLGSAEAATLVCGGDLEQPSGQPVQVSGLSRLGFVPGTTSHGVLLPAQQNQARLVENGVDVTAQIVVNPSP